MSSVPTKSCFCVAEGCSSYERKRGKYGYMTDVRFYPFPTQKKPCPKETLARFIRKREIGTKTKPEYAIFILWTANQLKSIHTRTVLLITTLTKV